MRGIQLSPQSTQQTNDNTTTTTTTDIIPSTPLQTPQKSTQTLSKTTFVAASQSIDDFPSKSNTIEGKTASPLQSSQIFASPLLFSGDLLHNFQNHAENCDSTNDTSHTSVNNTSHRSLSPSPPRARANDN